MRVTTKTLTSLGQTVRRRRALLSVLRAPAVESTGPVVNATRHALLDHSSPSERAWIDRIERQRRTLMASTRTFTLELLGARSTGSSERSIGRVTATASKPPRWSYLLFRVVREWQPVECVELGACVGISAAYQAAALELNGAGRLVTVEGTPALAQQASETLTAVGLADRADVVTGAFADVLPGVLEERSGRIDYVFIDGHHDGEATLGYLEKILPHLADRALLVFDDITWSDDMQEAWNHITRDGRFASTIDIHSIGFAVWDRGQGPSTSSSVRLRYA